MEPFLGRLLLCPEARAGEPRPGLPSELLWLPGFSQRKASLPSCHRLAPARRGAGFPASLWEAKVTQQSSLEGGGLSGAGGLQDRQRSSGPALTCPSSRRLKRWKQPGKEGAFKMILFHCQQSPRLGEEAFLWVSWRACRLIRPWHYHTGQFVTWPAGS